MSKYTVTLKQLVDDGIDLGLKTYPIFDVNYRTVLNNKIINHFMFREIGAETVAKFKFFFNRTLDEEMPLINKRYITELENTTPIYYRSVTETIERDLTNIGKDTSNLTNTNISNNKNVISNTPSGLLSIGNIDGDVYASNVAMNKTNDTITGNNIVDTTATTHDEYIKTITGLERSIISGDVITKFRDTLLNIDMEVIHLLDDCFIFFY